ncbi:MAG: transglutaminase-like domain-containing protein [Deltaproteobacteria bacterium]
MERLDSPLRGKDAKTRECRLSASRGGKKMTKDFAILMIFFLMSFAGLVHPADPTSDAPDSPRDSTAVFKAADSYEHALQVWKTPEDVSAWIASNFSYDSDRAMRLSENQRAKSSDFSIYTPSQFFATRSGVCVDLARFGVETLRSTDPKSDPKYLMIEFAPMHLAGNTLRLHWMASFRRDGRIHFFADSKRPGHIAGPYKETADFIRDYEQYRGRKILAFREAESYQKQQRSQARKLRASEKP